MVFQVLAKMLAMTGIIPFKLLEVFLMWNISAESVVMIDWQQLIKVRKNINIYVYLYITV